MAIFDKVDYIEIEPALLTTVCYTNQLVSRHQQHSVSIVYNTMIFSAD